METRQITLTLPEDLVRQAEAFAAEHNTTIDAMVEQLLRPRFPEEEKYREAVERILEIARRGPHFSGDPGSISREELHERR
jgi:dsDNA-specific endonuclease/ATPase MutS2